VALAFAVLDVDSSPSALGFVLAARSASGSAVSRPVFLPS
jgi:hypothetical protein